MPERADDRTNEPAADSPDGTDTTGPTGTTGTTGTVRDGGFTREELEAAWMQFQRDGQAPCPRDGAELEVELVREPTGGQPPEVRVRCPQEGREGVFTPPDRKDVAGWQE